MLFDWQPPDNSLCRRWGTAPGWEWSHQKCQKSHCDNEVLFSFSQKPASGLKDRQGSPVSSNSFPVSCRSRVMQPHKNAGQVLSCMFRCHLHANETAEPVVNWHEEHCCFVWYKKGGGSQLNQHKRASSQQAETALLEILFPSSYYMFRSLALPQRVPAFLRSLQHFALSFTLHFLSPLTCLCTLSSFFFPL